MFLKVDPSAAEPVYSQIVSQVKHAVASGLLRNGDRLPSIRGLARELRINPNTVIHAYRELEIENVIESRRGQGSFVTGAGPVMSVDNRCRILGEKVDRLLVEAYHLDLTGEQVMALLRKRLEQHALELSKKGGPGEQ